MYQIGLETSMRVSDFIFDCVHLLYYKCYERNLTRWILYRFSRLDKKQKSNKSFQYAVTAALNHKDINKNLQRIIKIKSFVNKHNWGG